MKILELQTQYGNTVPLNSLRKYLEAYGTIKEIKYVCTLRGWKYFIIFDECEIVPSVENIQNLFEERCYLKLIE